MALQIWLPLNNGKVQNQGVADAELTVSASWADIGKLGPKGFTNGAITASANTIGSIYNNKEMSFAFWIYINAPTGDKTGRGTPLIGQSDMTPPNNRKFSIFAYPSVNDLHWSWQNTGGSTFTGGSINGVLPSYKWTHVVFTYKDSVATVYVNGVKKSTSTGTSDTPNFYFATPILKCSSLEVVNDLRIYDHCLSLKEIKELTKGLCLYYPMDDKALESTTNIMAYPTPGSAASYAWEASKHKNAINVGGWSVGYNSGVGTPEQGYHAYWEVIDGIPTMVFKDLNQPLGLGHRWLGISSNADLCTTLGANTTYTISFEAKATVEGMKVDAGYYYSIDGTSNGFHDGYGSAILTKKWKRYSFTLTTKSTLVTSRSSRFYVYGMNNSSNGISYVRNFQVELKNHSTEYTPSTRNDKKVYDCSGFGFHGEAVGSITVSPDTPRNEVSYLFDGSTTGINLPIKDLMKTLLKDKCTINFWVKEGDTSSRSIYFGGYSGSNFNIEQQSGQLRVYWNATPDLRVGTISNNVWNMFTIVIDVETGIKIYQNGNLITTHSAALPDIASGFTRDFNIGKDSRTDSTMMEGKMSEFKIFASALSAEDILSLYKTSLATDDMGNSYSGQFDEIEKTKFSISNGITYAGLSELDGSGMEFKVLDDGSVWGRIHYLDVTNDKTFFANDTEVGYCVYKNNRFSLMDRVEDFGKQVVLKNVIPVIEEATFKTGDLDSAHVKYRNKSLKITGNTNAEVTSQTTLTFALDNTHIYYSRLEMYQETANGHSQIYWPVAEPSHFRITSSKAGEWQMASARINRTSFTNGSYPLRVDYDCIGNSGAMWFDGIMLIDLTEAFGLGFEPTKAWCDENIPYFTGEKVISIENLDNFNFEFMLTYPSLSSTAYNRWRQSVSPNHASVTTKDGVGLRYITQSWSGDYAGALTKSASAGSAKYSCNISGNWWAPIGQKSSYNSGYIPAANGSSQTSTELWVRVFPEMLNNLKSRIYADSFTSNNFYER